MTDEQKKSTLYLERAKVRGIILRSQEIGVEVTQSLLMQVDHLPIVTADDMRDAAATPMPSPANCDWPDGGKFTFHDEPGEHDPCYVVMPGGAMLSLNHHAGEGVDIARAKFIVAACNVALDHDFPRDAIAQAMQDAWNTICTDTGCHPLDIERQGKQLFFKPGHWVDLIALFLAPPSSHSRPMRLPGGE